MTLNRTPSRLARLLAATSLTMAGNGFAPAAMAQDSSDPPWRVGRLAQLTGSVSAHGAGATAWTAATLNVPLSNGDAIWTQPASGAVVQISDNRVALSESTELDLATLDNHQFIATEPQGELFFDLRDVPSGDTYAVTTPRGIVQLGGAGQYGIAAGDSGTPTIISVISGSAQIASGSFSMQIASGQSGTVTGSDTVQGTVGPLLRDGFLTAQLGEVTPAPAGPPAVRYMTGSESLGSYGNWQPSPQYGQVWYPRVSSGWAPYREGSWSYVAPWGWTWVDNEPWGFAPFHYGRWSQFDGRWGWVPAEQQAPSEVYQQPAYAPALVDFVVAGAVAGVVAGALAGGFGGHGPGYGGGYGGGGYGGGGGDVGWIPLAPHERYNPPFGASQNYMQRINYGRIDNSRTDNSTHIDSHNSSIDSHNTTIINNYANRSALTVMPAAAMARSQPVAAVARTGAAALSQGGRPVQFQVAQGGVPVHPAAETHGVTPAVAQRFGFHPAAAQAAAPGPAVNQALFRPHTLPAGRVPFRQVAGGAAATGPSLPQHPAQPAVGAVAPHVGTVATAPGALHGAAAPGPAVTPARPNGLPALRAPGAVPAGVGPGRAGAVHPDAVHPQALRPEIGQTRGGQEAASHAAAAPVPHSAAATEPHRDVPAGRPAAEHQAQPAVAQHHEPVRPHEAAAPAQRAEPAHAAAHAAAAPAPHAEPARAAPREAPRPLPAHAPATAPHPAAPAHPQPGPHHDDHRGDHPG